MWLDAHRRELAAPPDRATRLRLSDGHRVGRLAHARFPGGTLVRETSARHARAAARTRALLDDAGVGVIFEGAFEHDGLRVRADVLARAGSGFELIEVKSSVGPRQEHLRDLAIQTHVIDASGVELTGVQLLHMNSEYRFDGRAYDVGQLFRQVDLTGPVLAMLPEVRLQVAELRAVLDQPAAPEVAMGPQCARPDVCPFFDYCGRVSIAVAGREVPPIVGAGWTVPPGLEGPSSFLDVLYFSVALPRVAGTRPHERLPFAWALRHDAGGGGFENRSHCALGVESAPHGESLTALREALPDRGPVIMFSEEIAGVLAATGGRTPGGDRLAADLARRAVFLEAALPRRATYWGVEEPWSLDGAVRASPLSPSFGSRREAAAAFVETLASSAPQEHRRRVIAACEAYARERVEVLASLVPAS